MNMNDIITYKVNDGQYRAYERGNPSNQAWGLSENLAKNNLVKSNFLSPEKIVEDLKQYLEEIEERIDQTNEFLVDDSNLTEIEHTSLRISWEELVRTKQTIEKILGFPNA